jgi:hypothetical protein
MSFYSCPIPHPSCPSPLAASLYCRAVVKRDLFIPVRDRRASRRILTLRNAGKAALVLLVLVGVLALIGHFRKPMAGDNYGRLFGSRVAQPDLAKPRPVDVVTEQPAPAVTDQTAPDPMLVAPAAREQEVLGVTPAPALAPASAPAPATPVVQGGGEHVAIVGGTGGVAIVKSKGPAAPKLRGGFGRQ